MRTCAWFAAVQEQQNLQLTSCGSSTIDDLLYESEGLVNRLLIVTVYVTYILGFNNQEDLRHEQPQDMVELQSIHCTMCRIQG